MHQIENKTFEIEFRARVSCMLNYFKFQLRNVEDTVELNVYICAFVWNIRT